MKKLLLSCALLFSLCASAQVKVFGTLNFGDTRQKVIASSETEPFSIEDYNFRFEPKLLMDSILIAGKIISDEFDEANYVNALSAATRLYVTFQKKYGNPDIARTYPSLLSLKTDDEYIVYAFETKDKTVAIYLYKTEKKKIYAGAYIFISGYAEKVKKRITEETAKEVGLEKF